MSQSWDHCQDYDEFICVLMERLYLEILYEGPFLTEIYHMGIALT